MAVSCGPVGSPASSDIPPFPQALESFQSFLRELGHDGPIVWTFREDLYSVLGSRTWIRWPPPEANAAVAVRCYEAGRQRGLVEIVALFRVGTSLATSVFAPAADELQGWSEGFKRSVREPLLQAAPVSNAMLWRLHRCRAAYARYQEHEVFVHRRSDLG